MEPTKEILRAQDARAVLDSPVFKEAFNKVSEYIESQAVSCDPDNLQMAQRVVLSKQILAHVKRELVKIINDGSLSVKIHHLEQKEEGFFKKVLRR